jgi:type IV pilus assembly protein PilV
MQTLTQFCQCKKQRGIAMVEALIAILLFSLGVLALAGLQAVMSKNVTQSKLRGEASYLANQLIGQMWIDDPANLTNYAIASNACTNTYTNCTSWFSNVQNVLPSGSATVSFIGTEASITLTWQAPGESPSQLLINANINR